MSASIYSLRRVALSLFNDGVLAADPYLAVINSLVVNENDFELALDVSNKAKKRQGRWSKIHLIAFGKAACSMISAAIKVIPTHRVASQAIAITNDDNVVRLKNIEVIAAGHPLPDDKGQKAACRIVEQLKKTEHDELVLYLVSGGGSALISLPMEGITLNDKIETNKLLLSSGANIKQINCVRKHLSQIKGGQLAKYAMPADVHALILSDVIGDDVSSIASGATVADNSTFFDAINILKEKELWDKIPRAVRELLEKGVKGIVPETPKVDASFFKKVSYTLVASNKTSLDKVSAQAQLLGFRTEVFSDSLVGEAKEVAEQLVLYAKQKLETETTAIVAGGETTVTVNGTGKGGRNQEMALAFALAAEKHHLSGKWIFLSGGTDGRDGPTDAAGGIVDSDSLSRMRKARINPENRLINNDSYSALKKSQDLLMTGATGTNVADLQILLIQP